MDQGKGEGGKRPHKTKSNQKMTNQEDWGGPPKAKVGGKTRKPKRPRNVKAILEEWTTEERRSRSWETNAKNLREERPTTCKREGRNRATLVKEARTRRGKV